MYDCKTAGRRVTVVPVYADVSGIGDDAPDEQLCGHKCSEQWRCEWLAMCPLDELAEGR